MKKNSINYNRMVAAIIIIMTVTCTASFAGPRKDKLAELNTNSSIPVLKYDSVAIVTEAKLLVQRLREDHLITEVKGFYVEKRQDTLFINGTQQTDAIARKYLQGLKQAKIHVVVLSLAERQRQHPKASMNELLIPFIFSHPYHISMPGKEGC